jgi:perosamine synthetase
MSNTEVISTSFEPGAAVKEGTVPLCVPELGGNEWLYVKECLDTNWVSSAGPFVSRFEQSLASYVGADHAIATVNGTAALHVALIVAGVKPDDEVILPALSFIAPANAVRYAGAWPVFMDVEAEHWQIDPQKTADFIERECDWKNGELRNRNTGRRVSALLPVHILGHPIDLDPLTEIARKFDLALVEDATESLGAKYKGRMLGQTSDVACFSFNGNKLITTGGGGMIVTRKEEWADHARYLTTQAKDNPIEYIHNEVGFNYRLTNLQAALGCAQVEQLDEFLFRKRRIAQQYNEALLDLSGVSTLNEAAWATSACWLHTVLIDPEKYGVDRFELFRLLANEEIQARPLWQPLHRSPAHSESPAYYVEVADEIHRKALSLPSSVGLSEQEMARVVKVIRDGAQQPA